MDPFTLTALALAGTAAASGANAWSAHNARKSNARHQAAQLKMQRRQHNTNAANESGRRMIATRGIRKRRAAMSPANLTPLHMGY